MPLLELTLTMTEDGNPVAGFPVIVRLSPTEIVKARITKSGTDGSSYFGISSLATENIVVLFSDTNINVALNGQTNGQFTLQSGGFLLLVNGQLSAGSASNVQVNNNTGQTANLTFLEVGP